MKQSILPFAAKLLSTASLCRFSNRKVIHLFYHTVTNEYLPHIHPLYRPKTVQEFMNDLDYVLKYFEPVSIHDVYLDATQEKRIRKPSFHLSFDDGLREIYDVACPILYQKGIPCTLFVKSDFVDNRDLFFRYKAAIIISKTKHTELLQINYSDRHLIDEMASELNIDFQDFLKAQRPYLTVEELKSLQQKGFTIGAHSIDHPDFTLLTETEQIAQINQSCDYVQKTFNESRRYFAFPFSDEGIAHPVFKAIAGNIDLTFGITGINTEYNGRHIARIDMEKYGKNAKECVNKAYLKCLVKGNN